MIFFWIAVALGMGAVVAFIAREKGRAPVLWAAYGIVAPIIALPHILLARAANDETWTPVRFGIPEPEHPCPHCGAVVRGEAIVCRHCRKPLYEPQGSPFDEPKEVIRSRKAQEVEGASEWLAETFTKFAGPPDEAPAEWTEAHEELRANSYDRVADPQPGADKLNVAPARATRDAVMAERMRREEVRSRPIAAAAEKTAAELAAMEEAELHRAEEDHRANEAHRAEEDRRLDQARAIEEAHRAEEARLAEVARRAEEEARAAEEARDQYAARLAEVARRAEEARAAAEKAACEAEEIRKETEARIAAANAAREAEEARLAEERRRIEELRAAEAARLAAEAEAQRAMEAERLAAEQAAAQRAAEMRRAEMARAERSEPRLETPRAEREFVIDPADRMAPSGARPSLTAEPDMRLIADHEPQPRRRVHDDGRMRAPLSSDGTERKLAGSKKPRDARKVAALAAAAAIVGFLVPWAAMQMPDSQSDERAAAVPPPGLVPPNGDEVAGLAPDAADKAGTPEGAGEKPAEPPRAAEGKKDDAEEVGTAKLAAPVPPPRPAAEPPKPKVVQPFQAPTNDPNVAKAEPKDELARLEPPAPKPQPKAQPKQQAKAAPRPQQGQDDFMAMVGRALGGTPNRATNASVSDVDPNDPAVGSAGGQLVQQVQEKLRDRGFDPGSIDGLTGPKTVQAIRAYQQSVGMKPDGRIDMALMERLGIVGQQLHVFGR